MQLQEILAFWGYYQSRIDGQYGPRTVAAVQEWQTALASLNVGRADGVYGPRTHAAAAASYATLAALLARVGVTIHQSLGCLAFDGECTHQTNDQWRHSDHDTAMDPEVADAIWAAIQPLLPVPVDDHPLGCHNPRVPDRVCFRGILIRLVTGASWIDIEAIMNFEVSDTTLHARHDEWIAAGVFDQLEAEARAGYDRILELNLDVVAIDGSLHKAPYGGEGTGKSPVDRAKLGWKWSVASERSGIPIGWAIDGANRNDVAMLEPTLDAIAGNGLLADIGTVTLDRSYDYPAIRDASTPADCSISTSNDAAPNHSPAPHNDSPSDCAGSSKQPTRGGRTTGNSDDPPTARTATATPPSNSQPPCSSSAASSTTATDGHTSDRLPAQGRCTAAQDERGGDDLELELLRSCP